MNIHNKAKVYKIKLAFLVSVLVMATACGKSLDEQIAEQLKLGQKYLIDLDYDNAIVAFQKVIEIDPQNEEAYRGIAEAYMEQEDDEQAVLYLEQGFAELGEESVTSEYLELLVDTYRSLGRDCEESNDMDAAEKYYNRILQIDPDDSDAAERKEILASRRELEQYYEDIVNTSKQIVSDNDSDISSSFMFDEDFENLAMGLKHPIIYQLDQEYYLGVYPEGYIYYGEMKDGLREGKGAWFWGYLNPENGYLRCYIFSGMWNNDYPNGEGKLVMNLLNRDARNIMKDVMTGNCVNGYFDGPVVDVWNYQDGSIETWDIELHGGKAEVLEYLGEDSECPYVISYSRENGAEFCIADGIIYYVPGTVKE